MFTSVFQGYSQSNVMLQISNLVIVFWVSPHPLPPLVVFWGRCGLVMEWDGVTGYAFPLRYIKREGERCVKVSTFLGKKVSTFRRVSMNCVSPVYLSDYIIYVPHLRRYSLGVRREGLSLWKRCYISCISQDTVFYSKAYVIWVYPAWC